MAINFLTTTNTLPEIQINDAGNNPRLELQESGSVSGGISTTGGALVFEASSGIEKARILSTGQFLIGHTSYYYAGTYLQVGNTSDNQNGLQITTSTTGNGYILFGDGTGANAYTGQIRYNHTDNFMRFRSNSADAMTIDSNQRVGIGTLTPSYPLHVYNADAPSDILARFQTADNSTYIQLVSAGSSWQIGATADSLDWYNDNNTAVRMSLLETGNLGIGTVSPTYKLDVETSDDVVASFVSTDNKAAISISDDDTTGYFSAENGRVGFGTGLGASSSNISILTSNSNVGIGTVSPSYKLDVAGAQMRLGDSNQTTTYFRMEATNTAGAPARAVGILQKGYESRAQGIFHEDTGKSNEEWFSGIPYGATFNNWQVGYDSSGGQPEYTANAILTAYHDKSVYLNAYGSGTYTGTATKYLAVTSSGKIIETGSGGVLPGGPYLPLAGGTMTGDVIFGDGVVAKFGAGQDLRIQSLADDGYIQSYTGDLIITQNADNKDIVFNNDDGNGNVKEYFKLDGSSADGTYTYTKWVDNGVITFGGDEDLRIWHDSSNANGYIRNYTNNLVIENVFDNGDIIFNSDDGSGGVTEYFRLDGSDEINYFSKSIKVPDNVKLMIGSSQDLQIQHTGSESQIFNSTGQLDIRTSSQLLVTSSGGENMIKAVNNGAVELYYDNTKTLETTSTGITAYGSRSIFAADTVVNSFSGTAGVEVYKNAGDSVLMVHQDDGNHESVLHFRTGGNDTKIIVPANTRALQIDTETTTDALMLNPDGHLTLASGITATNTSFSGTMNIAAGIYHIGDTDTFFGFVGGNDTFGLTTGGGSRMDANNAGVRFGGAGARIVTVKDEDDMAANSNVALATQQSIKAYVDNSITGSTSFRGAWDPDAGLNGGYGNPNLNTVTKQDGYYYICSDNGSATPNGTGTTPNSWHTGDWVVYNSNLGSSGEWQKIDNSSVISGAGTGGKVVKWSGSGTSETLTDGPITFSSNDSTFAGNATFTGASHNVSISSGTNIRGSNHLFLQGDASYVQIKSPSNYIYYDAVAHNFRKEDGTANYLIINSTSATFSGDIVLADSKAIKLGNGGTFQLWHQSGTNGNSFIDEQSTGELYIRSNSTIRLAHYANNTASANFNPAGAVELYYDTAKKFETTSTGVSVTGSVVASGDVMADTHFTSSDTNATLSTNSDGTIFLRPNGKGSTTAQSTFTTALASIGTNATFGGNVTVTGVLYTDVVQTRSGTSIDFRHQNASVIMRVDTDDARVGIGTSSPTYKLSVSGAIEAGGKITYSKSIGSLDTTGFAVAGLTTGFNGASAGFTFTCFGHTGAYQRIVYSCYNGTGTWYAKKVIDEGTNQLDVAASANGSTITFTFKATSSTMSYSPRVTIEATGHSINSTYA